jgi:hypothetical protein
MNRKGAKRRNQGPRGKVVIGAVDDPIHPVQFWANSKGQKWDPLLPEKKLWSAVLEDAFNCCVKGHVSGESSRVRKQEEIESAKAWFSSEETHIGTFLWVCKTLDLDPKRILKKVAGVYESRKMAA